MEHEHISHVQPLESPREYAKFAAVIIGITLVSLLLTSWRSWELSVFLGDFMAVFLVTFASFKLISLEEFTLAYRQYDLVAKKFPFWAYIFPIVEGGLGIAYLLSTRHFTLNLLTMLITGVGGVGVWRELNRKHRDRHHIQCACLGAVIRLPLTKVSLVEGIAMFAMALLMLAL